MPEGYLYILFNPAFRQNHWKIGLTTRTPELRAKELSDATGVPEAFEVVHKVKVRDCERAERLVHGRLNECRLPGREFFVLDLDQALRAVMEAANEVGHAETRPPAKAREIPMEPPSQTRPTMDEEWNFETGAAAGRHRRSRGKELPIEEHLRKLPPEKREIFYRLQERILSLDPQIEGLSCQPYVRFRRARNFAEVTFHAKQQSMKVWIKEMSYDDPLGIVETYSGPVDWRLKSFVWLECEDQLDYVARLIEESMHAAG